MGAGEQDDDGGIAAFLSSRSITPRTTAPTSRFDQIKRQLDEEASADAKEDAAALLSPSSFTNPAPGGAAMPIASGKNRFLQSAYNEERKLIIEWTKSMARKYESVKSCSSRQGKQECLAPSSSAKASSPQDDVQCEWKAAWFDRFFADRGASCVSNERQWETASEALALFADNPDAVLNGSAIQELSFPYPAMIQDIQFAMNQGKNPVQLPMDRMFEKSADRLALEFHFFHLLHLHFRALGRKNGPPTSAPLAPVLYASGRLEELMMVLNLICSLHFGFAERIRGIEALFFVEEEEQLAENKPASSGPSAIQVLRNIQRNWGKMALLALAINGSYASAMAPQTNNNAIQNSVANLQMKNVNPVYNLPTKLETFVSAIPRDQFPNVTAPPSGFASYFGIEDMKDDNQKILLKRLNQSEILFGPMISAIEKVKTQITSEKLTAKDSNVELLDFIRRNFAMTRDVYAYRIIEEYQSSGRKLGLKAKRYYETVTSSISSSALNASDVVQTLGRILRDMEVPLLIYKRYADRDIDLEDQTERIVPKDFANSVVSRALNLFLEAWESEVSTFIECENECKSDQIGIEECKLVKCKVNEKQIEDWSVVLGITKLIERHVEEEKTKKDAKDETKLTVEEKERRLADFKTISSATARKILKSETFKGNTFAADLVMGTQEIIENRLYESLQRFSGLNFNSILTDVKLKVESLSLENAKLIGSLEELRNEKDGTGFHIDAWTSRILAISLAAFAAMLFYAKVMRVSDSGEERSSRKTYSPRRTPSSQLSETPNELSLKILNEMTMDKILESVGAALGIYSWSGTKKQFIDAYYRDPRVQSIILSDNGDAAPASKTPSARSGRDRTLVADRGADLNPRTPGRSKSRGSRAAPVSTKKKPIREKNKGFFF